MVTVAEVLDDTLWRISFRAAHRAARRFVAMNVVLLASCGALIYHLSGAAWLAGVVLALLAALSLIAFYKELQFAILRTSRSAVFHEQIEPTVEHFLESYNLFGTQWEQVVRELVDKGRLLTLSDVYRAPVAHPSHEKEEKVDAVLRYASQLAQWQIFTVHSQRMVLTALGFGYGSVFLTLPPYFVFVELSWVPLVWLLPAFGWLFLEITGKVEKIMPPIPTNPGKTFVTKELMPLVTGYCEATNTDYDHLLTRAKDVDPYFLEPTLRAAASTLRVASCITKKT